jgi:hypothetical protein
MECAITKDREKDREKCKRYYDKKGKLIKREQYARNEERVKKLIAKIEALGYKVVKVDEGE